MFATFVAVIGAVVFVMQYDAEWMNESQMHVEAVFKII